MMRRRTLVYRSLVHHRRTHLAVMLGVAAGTAALAGALLVGDSMRTSLRDRALQRLGPVTHAMIAPRFFRASVADDIGVLTRIPAAPIILLPGAATHADSKARANKINVLGVDERFWKLDATTDQTTADPANARTVVLNAALANELGATPGDDILLRLRKPGAVSVETLLGRRDDTTLTLRLTVQSIAPTSTLREFDPRPAQQAAMNAFVPLETLQRALAQPQRVNALLLSLMPDQPAASDRLGEGLDDMFRAAATLDDYGLKLRVNEALRYIALESESMLIPPAIEQTADAAGDAVGLSHTPIITYLANAITREAPAESPDSSTDRSIPYSTVSAIGTLPAQASPMTLTNGAPAQPPAAGEILLNDWAATDLRAQLGDKIRLTYYITDKFGKLATENETFTLSGIVRLDGPAADPGFTPEYKGVTDVKSLADWDAPFPVDLKRVRDKDEDYWDRHRATPKAFISLADAERLWADDADRFGRYTSIRFHPPADADITAAADSLRQELLNRIDPASVGLAFEPIRAQALAAGQGSTDFGGLFIGFSFFLILAACLLVALLFRLGVERRSAQIGLLLATGFSPKQVSRITLAEGAVIAGIGSALGLVAALGYAWLMLAGLRTWWAEAVNAPFLQLHVAPLSLAIGFIAGTAVALVSITIAVRGLTRQSPRRLLAGLTSSPLDPTAASKRGRASIALALIAAAAAAGLIALSSMTDAVPTTAGFFGGGASMLVACVAVCAARLRSVPRGLITTPGPAAHIRLGLRNAPRNAGRSLLTITLVASATFVVTALQAFRLDADDSPNARHSGSGGFALYAESTAPLTYDLNTPDGRDALGITASDDAALLKKTAVFPFRLRPGEEASCLNLYKPTMPRILGATDKFIERGGFRFASSIAENENEQDNPWHLLNRPLPDGAIPVIGDESAVLWQLHLGLGKDLTLTDERGRPQTLRFVALLGGSALQGELVIAESRFTDLFPSISGYSFFLIDVDQTSPPSIANIEQILERDLAPYGFDVARTADRLRAYFAIQNTYLSTFQTLGGLGLILGTIGLAAVQLRNTWERRGELALLRALGYPRRAVSRIVLAETIALVVAGLLCGTLPALVAIAPHLTRHADTIPWPRIAATLTAVLLVGTLAATLALRTTTRAPLIESLRTE